MPDLTTKGKKNWRIFGLSCGGGMAVLLAFAVLLWFLAPGLLCSSITNHPWYALICWDDTGLGPLPVLADCGPTPTPAPTLTPAPIDAGAAYLQSSWDGVGQTVLATHWHGTVLLAVEFTRTPNSLSAGELTVTRWQQGASSSQVVFKLPIWSYADPIALFSPDGKLLAVSSGTESPNEATALTLWDLATGQQLAQFADYEGDAAFSPDGSLLAMGWGQRSAALNHFKVQVWHTDTNKLAWEAAVAGTQAVDEVSRVAFSPTGRWLIFAANQARIQIWDVATQNLVQSLTGAYEGNFAFSNDERYLALTSDFASLPTISLYSSADWQVLTEVRDSAQQPIQPSFAQQHPWLVLTGGKQVWDTDQRKSLATVMGEFGTLDAFSTDEQYLLSQVTDNALLWRTSDWQLQQQVSHSGLMAAFFVPDAPYFVTVAAGEQQLMYRLWAIGNTR